MPEEHAIKWILLKSIRNLFIRNFRLYKKNRFHSPVFSKELAYYTFIRNFGYKEQFFMVKMSSLKANFIVFSNRAMHLVKF